MKSTTHAENRQLPANQAGFRLAITDTLAEGMLRVNSHCCGWALRSDLYPGLAVVQPSEEDSFEVVHIHSGTIVADRLHWWDALNLAISVAGWIDWDSARTPGELKDRLPEACAPAMLEYINLHQQV